MKRIISSFTILCLVVSMFGIPASAFAESIHPMGTTSTSSSQEDMSVDDDLSLEADSYSDSYGGSLPVNQGALKVASMSTTGISANSASANTGIVDVTMVSQFAVGDVESLTVALKNRGVGTSPEPKSFEPKESNNETNEYGYYVRFNNVAPGDYQLLIDGAAGNMYKTFEQDIEVTDGNCTCISLVDVDVDQYTKTRNVSNVGELKGMGMGLLAYGDFNKDDMIDNQDASLLIDALARQSNGDIDDDELAIFDLDGDSYIGLADLQRFAMNVNASSTAEPRVIKDNTMMTSRVEDSATVAVDNNWDNMFIDNGASTQIKRDDDAEITPEHAVEFSIEPSIVNENNSHMAGICISVPADKETTPTDGTIAVEYEDVDGTTKTMSFNIDGQAIGPNSVSPSYVGRIAVMAALTPMSTEMVYNRSTGLITIDFGKQIAVKKVTIKITAVQGHEESDGTRTAANLAEISKVEFLNGTEDKIPEPDLNVPTNLKATAGDKKFDVSWKPETNIEGYQVEVSAEGKKDILTSKTESIGISNLGSKKLVNGTEYTVRVRTYNGGWQSPWSAPIKVTPKATNPPKVPEYITLTPGFTDIKVSWKAAEDAETYTVYWYADDDRGNEQSFSGIAKTSYLITGLRTNTKYHVQVEAFNDVKPIGYSGRSGDYTTTTKTSQIKIPWFNLINRQAQANSTGQMFDDPIASIATDVPNNESANPGFTNNMVVDGDYSTYWYSHRTDGSGNAKPGGYADGVRVNFKEPHKMNSMAFTTYLGSGYGGSIHEMYVTVYTTDNPNGKRFGAGNGLKYASIAGATNSYMVTFPTTENITGIHIGIIRFNWPNWLPKTFSELAFYEYDSLSDDVSNLWADTLHTVLKDDVDDATLRTLEAELEKGDPQTITASNPTGERRYNYNSIKLELESARKVLEHEGLSEPVIVTSALDKSQGNYVGGSNAWQPLGVSVKSGDQINVFVGASNAKTGNSALRLYVGQPHAVSSKPIATACATLQVGMNTVTIPDMTDLNVEEGGSLYVEYISSTKTYRYSVRVDGGVDVPYLDLLGISDTAERQQRCVDYVNELDDFVNNKLRGIHNEKHVEGDIGVYDNRSTAKTCIANITEIGLDYLLYSVPASQIWSGLKGADNYEKAINLERNLRGGDDAMLLYYQHKGISNLPVAEGDTTSYQNRSLPKSRQNIRYMTMFAGAFMYASGNHIGIEWGSVTGVLESNVVSDINGKHESGRYFGWGLNHEIGHEINQGAYAVAEVTNNYYAQLAQSHDSIGTTRWGDYSKIYSKVTSGSAGEASGKTGIAMYWQLHLAYDGMDYLANHHKPSYNYKMYDNYTDLFNNLIFARIDYYARNPSLAPNKGTALSLGNCSSKGNALLRLACAATEKDLRGYFKAWGVVPDSVSDAYASQFPAEERGIQYVTDDARNYMMEHYTANPVAPGAPTIPAPSYQYGSNRVTIDLSSCSTTDNILGYEILRNGQACGFVKKGTTSFTDVIQTVNNRVYTYEVRIVDNWLQRSPAALSGKVKVHHDNVLSKSNWSMESNLLATPNEANVPEDQADDGEWTSSATAEETSACTPKVDPENLSVNKAIDGNYDSVFSGTSTSGNAQMTINFGGPVEIMGFRYTPGAGVSNPISSYKIEISDNGQDFTQVASGSFNISNGKSDVWLDDSDTDRLNIYDASYMRLTAVGQSSISVAEIDVLGPTGDDVEFLSEDSIGYLATDTQVGTDAEGAPVVIPQGSLVVAGTYQGSPSYNVVVLYDDDKLKYDSPRPQGDAIINGSQIIFAEMDADDQLIPNMKKGYWVYYITPDEMNEPGWHMPSHISAELYRVDNALTNEGQRLVANCMEMTVPSRLFNISLSFGTPFDQNAPQSEQGIEPMSATIPSSKNDVYGTDQGGQGGDDGDDQGSVPANDAIEPDDGGASAGDDYEPDGEE